MGQLERSSSQIRGASAAHTGSAWSKSVAQSTTGAWWPESRTATLSPHWFEPLMDDIVTLRRILKTSRKIAMVGLSDQWYRPSHFVAKYLQQHGYRIFPVNPRLAGSMLLGEPVVASVLDLKEPVDMVDVFRRTQDVLPVAEQALQIGARVLWQQIGVVNREADALVRAAGMDSVMDRCVKIEHGRIFGGLNWVGVNTRVISAKRPVW